MFWLAWIVVALVCLAGEAVSVALILASFGAAALVVAPLSLVVPLPAQVVAFGALSLLLLGVARPAALRLLPHGDTEASEPRIGPRETRALAVQPIDQRQGQIRVGSGEFWTARADDPDMAIAPGREVQIVRMEGLIARVRPVAASGENLPQQAIGGVLESPSESTAPISGAGVAFGLSAREIEVLRLVALGLTNQEIASRLFLSPRTVHHHVSHILTKMDASSRMEAVRLGVEHGLVTLHGPRD
jgi:DNA-binding CsgD family transcriptional regulator/membrane protein implicated in regulation of membrane protease activity